MIFVHNVALIISRRKSRADLTKGSEVIDCIFFTAIEKLFYVCKFFSSYFMICTLESLSVPFRVSGTDYRMYTGLLVVNQYVITIHIKALSHGSTVDLNLSPPSFV